MSDTRNTAALVVQELGNHREAEKGFPIGSDIRWAIDIVEKAILAERERCARIAEQSAYVAGVDLSSGYTMACGVIADKIRAEGGA
jgi:hypothetical protein